MEVERYKMVYTTKIDETLIDELLEFTNNKLYNEIISDNMRILGNDFVKNNKNKGKLIINTIFLL